MIIFNLWAIIVFPVIILILLGMDNLFPSVMKGAYSGLISGTITFVIGGIAELFGIRGRIFFLPIWLIGLGVLGYGAYTLWGILGIIAPMAVIALAFWRWIKELDKKQAEHWKKAQPKLAELKAYSQNLDSLAFWTLVQESLFLSSAVRWPSEVCVHNLAVAQIVLSKEAGRLEPKELMAWTYIQNYTEIIRTVEKSDRFNHQIRSDLRGLLEARLAGFAKKATPSVAPVAVPPKMPSPLEDHSKYLPK